MAKRYELNDDQGARIAEMLSGKKSDPGRTAIDNRLFADGVLWILRSGAQWDELPERYGKWMSVHKRLTRWAKDGVWEGVFRSHGDPKNAYVVLDAAIVRGHQQADTGKGGAKKGADEALGRSRGGLTTKIDLIADALGQPPRFLLTGGQVHESRTAEAMLEGVESDAVIAGKAYDSNAIRGTVKAARMKAVIRRAAPAKDPYDTTRCSIAS